MIRLSDGLQSATPAIRVSLCLIEPITTNDPHFDTLLAGLAEFWPAQDNLPIPEWANSSSRILQERWDVEPIKALQALARSQTPKAFFRHGIYLTQSELASLK